jgi:hypothetical protein
MDGRKTVFDTSSGYFVSLGPMESLRTPSYEKMLLWLYSRLSFRNASTRMEMIRDQNGTKTLPMTDRNQAERQGSEILNCMTAEANMALTEAGYEDGIVTLPADTEPPKWSNHPVDISEVEAAAKALGIETFNAEDFEKSKTVANISIDDVCVKAQTTTRKKRDDLNGTSGRKKKSKKK